MSPARLAALAALGILALPARAESPLYGSFQFQLNSYRPNIDAEFKGKLGCNANGQATAGGGTRDCAPFRDVFGTGGSTGFGFQLAKSLYVGLPGTLDLGLGAGYWSKSGKGLVQNSLTASGDDTTFHLVPLSLTLTWRFDGFATSVPLVPFLKASLLRYQWWVTGGGGGTASSSTGSGSGATMGYGLGAGMAFLLDFLDPQLGREMDRDIGINHTYLYVEATRDKVDDFGSKKSWDLSNDKSLTWSGGILFVF
jgi:hypothetical protein